MYVVYLVYLSCEIHDNSPYNVRFGPGKVLENSLVLIHQNPWEPCIHIFITVIAHSSYEHQSQYFMAPGLFVQGLIQVNNKDTSKALQCWSYPLVASWCDSGYPPVFFPHKEPPRQDLPGTFCICMHPTNERWCYTVTLPLIGQVQTHNDPWLGQWLYC